MSEDAIRDSLNASLESLDALEKSDEPSDEQLEELLGDSDVKDRIEGMLKAKKKKDDDDDDDDDDDKDEKGEVPEQFKSLDDEIEEDIDDEEVSKLVSGVPVLKSFEKKLVKTMETLAVHSQVLKSLVESQVEQVEMAKSTNSAVDVFRSVPRPRKGMTVASGEVLAKDFEDGDGPQAPEIDTNQIKQAMQKAFNDGVVKMHDVSRCELSNWALESVPAVVQETLVKSASAKEE